MLEARAGRRQPEPSPPGGTNSGGASVALHTLFTTVDSSKLTTDAHLQGRLAYSPPPFQQIPIKYTNWEAINASVAVNAPQIMRVDANGTEHPVLVAFFMATRERKKECARGENEIKSLQWLCFQRNLRYG